jgi:ankyrin repeat protein
MGSLTEQLFAAIDDDSVEGVAVLLKKCASVNAKDKQGWTPLVHAFADMRTNGAEFLISNGAKLDSKEALQSYPLKLAEKHSDHNLAKLLDKLE